MHEKVTGKTTQFSLDRKINRPFINAQYVFAKFNMHFLNSYITKLTRPFSPVFIDCIWIYLDYLFSNPSVRMGVNIPCSFLILKLQTLLMADDDVMQSKICLRVCSF